MRIDEIAGKLYVTLVEKFGGRSNEERKNIVGKFLEKEAEKGNPMVAMAALFRGGMFANDIYIANAVINYEKGGPTYPYYVLDKAITDFFESIDYEKVKGYHNLDFKKKGEDNPRLGLTVSFFEEDSKETPTSSTGDIRISFREYIK